MSSPPYLLDVNSGYMILPILQIPHPLLRTVSAPIQQLTPALRKLAGDMLDTTRKHHAVGLAAVQVGSSVRMITISPSTGCPYAVLINPRLVSHSADSREGEEGCHSIGEGKPRWSVRRYTQVVVEFTDRADQPCRLTAGGLAARVLQHEIDHLNGKLITDYVKVAAFDRGCSCYG